MDLEEYHMYVSSESHRLPQWCCKRGSPVQGKGARAWEESIPTFSYLLKVKVIFVLKNPKLFICVDPLKSPTAEGRRVIWDGSRDLCSGLVLLGSLGLLRHVRTHRQCTLHIHNWQGPLGSSGTGPFLQLLNDPKQKTKSKSLSCLVGPNVTLALFICPSFQKVATPLTTFTFQPYWTKVNPPTSLILELKWLSTHQRSLCLPSQQDDSKGLPEKVTFLCQYFHSPLYTTQGHFIGGDSVQPNVYNPGSLYSGWFCPAHCTQPDHFTVGGNHLFHELLSLWLHQHFPKQVSFYCVKVRLAPMAIPSRHTWSQGQRYSIITRFINTRSYMVKYQNSPHKRTSSVSWNFDSNRYRELPWTKVNDQLMDILVYSPIYFWTF